MEQMFRICSESGYPQRNRARLLPQVLLRPEIQPRHYCIQRRQQIPWAAIIQQGEIRDGDRPTFFQIFDLGVSRFSISA